MFLNLAFGVGKGLNTVCVKNIFDDKFSVFAFRTQKAECPAEASIIILPVYKHYNC